MNRHYAGIAIVNPTTKSIERAVCHHDINDGSPRLVPRIINESRIEVPYFLNENDVSILRRASINS